MIFPQKREKGVGGWVVFIWLKTDNFQVMIMKKIHHPNIVNLLDVHITKHNIYLIMELIRGEELYDKIGK